MAEKQQTKPKSGSLWQKAQKSSVLGKNNQLWTLILPKQILLKV